MKVKMSKNGSIKMTAQSKKDSLNLLKFMASAAGDESPEMKALIEKKEKECEEIEKKQSC